MFGLFKGNNFLGIDFGASSIKVVELKVRGQKPYLSNYGWTRLDFIQNTVDAKMDNYDDKMKLYLQALVEKMNPRAKAAYASMPGFNGLLTIIELPEMKKSELDQAINFEAHKYIPTSLEEVSISWDILSKKEEKVKTKSGEKKSKKIQVLLVAAPKDKVVKYEKLIKFAKLKVEAIELETFSLARSLVGDDAGTYLIVDIGFRACAIVLVKKGTVIVNRNIDAGGSEITSSIADNLNISKQRAEIMKKQGKDLINGKESAIILPTLDAIVDESLRVVDAYKKNNANIKIDGIILSGGTAKLRGIEDYFSKKMNIRTTIGDPWKRINYEKKLDPIIKKVGSSFSVALGLALRGVEEYRRR